MTFVCLRPDLELLSSAVLIFVKFGVNFIFGFYAG
jgi:hypothetical protein